MKQTRMLTHSRFARSALCAITLAIVGTSAAFAAAAEDAAAGARDDLVFDVSDYGADATGDSDSAPAFQRMIQAIGDRRHIKIVIPPGRYLLSRPIRLTASGNAETYGLAVEGAGQDVTELIVDNPEGGILWHGELINRLSVSISDLSIVAAREHAGIALQFDKPTLGVKHRTQFLAENLCIRGDTFDTGYFDIGLLVRGAWYPRLRNVQIAGPYGKSTEHLTFAMDHGILLEDSYNPMISNCRVWSADSGLTYRSKEHAMEDGSVINCYVVGAKRGIVVDLKAPGQWEEPGFRITQCHINYRDYGVTLRGSRQATIDHCLFYCSDRDGADFPMYKDTRPRDFAPADINLEYASDVIIDGNLFTEPANPARVAVRISKQSGYVLIRGNQFNLEGLAVKNESPVPSWSVDNFFGGRRNFTRGGERYDDRTGSLRVNDLN